MNIPYQRLKNQRVSEDKFKRPEEVVRWLGAMQAQDYLGALWAVGLRMEKAIEAEIEKALNERKLVRTWPMRGTLHFVAPENTLWMLELMASKVYKRITSYYRQIGLTEEILEKSKKLFIQSLQGGKQLTRPQMYKVLEAEGLPTKNYAGLNILGNLAQRGIICFGQRDGKQQTFVLLEEWVPNLRKLSREEALAEITLTYFTSHGPAMVQDMMWWSGLNGAEVKEGIEMVKSKLSSEEIDGRTFWFSTKMVPVKDLSPKTFLLPPYDEYGIAYKDRSDLLKPEYFKQILTRNGIFSAPIVINGQGVGMWKRVIKKDTVSIQIQPFRKLTKEEKDSIQPAADSYAHFLGLHLSSIKF